MYPMMIVGADGKQLNAPGSPAWYGQMLEFLLPESYPSIAGLSYFDTSVQVTSVTAVTINVPSNIERLLGFAVFSADSSDLAWTTGVRMDVTLQQESLMTGVPVAIASPLFNSALNLGYFPISRPCHQGDSLRFAFTSPTAAVNMYVTPVYLKMPAALI